MITISDLSEQVAALVEQQEPIVEKAQQHAETAVGNYETGNAQLSRAIISARNARRYKWYILWVCREYYDVALFGATLIAQ